MIKINLLPIEYRKIEKKSVMKVDVGFIASILFLGLVFAIMIVVWIIQDINLNKLESDKSKLLADKAKYDQEIKFINQITKAKNDLEQRNELIESLIKHKFSWAHVIDEITTAIPGEVLWIEKISDKSLGANIAFQIEGKALSNYDVASFLTNLGKSMYIESVKLLNTKNQTIGMRDVSSFVITGNTTIARPTETIISNGKPGGRLGTKK